MRTDTWFWLVLVVPLGALSFLLGHRARARHHLRAALDTATTIESAKPHPEP